MEDSPAGGAPPAASPEEAAEVPKTEEPHQVPEPPQHLSRNAIRLRLRRVMTPHADGTFKIPQQALDDFSGENKDRLYALFEKSGYDKDWGSPK